MRQDETIMLNKTTNVYNWLEKKLLPPLVALKKYNGEDHILEDQAFTDELTDYRIMPLQIRQLRVPESKSSNTWGYFSLQVDFYDYLDMNKKGPQGPRSLPCFWLLSLDE